MRLPLAVCFFLGALSAVSIDLLHYVGLLQGLELRGFDQLLLRRTEIPIDSRIAVIGEMEADIRRYGHPLSDKVLADALGALENAGARVIGIDKYRDVAVSPGTEDLNAVLKQYGNIVWIFFAGNSQMEFIPAPAVVANNPERTGFNDVVEDPDGITRRGLLFLDVDNNTYYAFPLLLALHYLAAENIRAETDPEGYLRLNGVSLPKIGQNFGVYSKIDASGYQVMLDYPGLPQSFSFFTLSDLLDGKIPGEAIRDKIVLIGGTAPSLHDYRLLPNELRRFGIEHHAFFISQLLHTAMDKKLPLRSWSETAERIWLFGWCLVGAFTGLLRGSLVRLLGLIAAQFLLLMASNVFLLNQGWWTPLIGPLFGWSAALAWSVLYFSSRERAERNQLMQLFASHVSQDVATKLWEDREEFFSEGGVRPDMLTATVLFTDLSNFTTITESMEPLVLMKWLNQYMEEMSSVVIEHGGMVNKYIGDAIMAVFGVPFKRETEGAIADDAQRAVRCALTFNRRLRELNQEWKAQAFPLITMRAGIFTGPLVAGSLGGSLRMEYTVIGDTVNTASRLESYDKALAPPDQENPCRILMGETTYNYVSHFCTATMIGESQLKGKNQCLKIYLVSQS